MNLQDGVSATILAFKSNLVDALEVLIDHGAKFDVTTKVKYHHCLFVYHISHIVTRAI